MGVPVIGNLLAVKISVTQPLLDRDGMPVVIEPHKWEHSDMWDAVLSPTVLVSRKELLLLVAERMGQSRNRDGMRRVALCKWMIGKRVIVTTSSEEPTTHYWGCGSYSHLGDNPLRPTWVEVEGYDRKGGRQTSRLAFVVCGIQLTNVKNTMGIDVPESLRDVQDDTDQVTFLLVRYAKAHPLALMRGPESRPVCPGPLKNTHCLWTWATRPEGYERGCFRTRPWERHARYFGRTVSEQNQVKENDRLAWYDIIQITNVRTFANVQKDPDMENVFLQTAFWC